MASIVTKVQKPEDRYTTRIGKITQCILQSSTHNAAWEFVVTFEYDAGFQDWLVQLAQFDPQTDKVESTPWSAVPIVKLCLLFGARNPQELVGRYAHVFSEGKCGPIRGVRLLEPDGDGQLSVSDLTPSSTIPPALVKKVKAK